MLSSSTMGSEAWSFAMRHYVARVQWSVVTQLGGRYPRLPPFGTKVFVKKRSWQRIKDEFTEKVVAARVLCPSLDVAKGFLVKTEDGSYLTTMVAVENVKEISGEFEVDAPPARADEPGVRRRMRGKTAITQIEEEILAKLGPLDQEHLLQDEELAAAFIDAGDYSMKAVEELLEGLWLGEQLSPNRRGAVFSGTMQVSVHVLGMYRHGGVVGATLLARTRPLLTQFLVKAMKKQMVTETSFTTLSINFNTPMQCHKDYNNQPGQSACLIGCGNYVGGALWCHQPDKDVRDAIDWHKVDGRWLPGHRHQTYHRAVVFDPCELHQPLPWQGNRITLTAYTAGCAENCNQPHRDLLQDLGFPLPPQMPQAVKPEGGGGGGSVEKEGKAAVRFLRPGDQGLGENLNSGSGDGVVRAGDLPGLGSGENLKSGSGDGVVRAGDLHGLGPGENLKLGSGDDVVRGAHCKCRGWEVDPSLCVCELPGEGPLSGEPQHFFIGDEYESDLSEDAWMYESWGAFGPPSVASMKAVKGEDGVSYEILASECPLEVGWDLFDGYLDEIRCVLAEEENLERALLDESIPGNHALEHVEACKSRRLELESEMEKWQRPCWEPGSDRLCAANPVAEEGEDAPLHTKTIPNEVVRKEIARWVPSMVSEYESLIRENDAVEPFAEETLEQWKKEGREFDLVPGKTVHTIKAFTGRLKTRAVICGNFLGQTFTKEQKYAAGADGVLIRILLRMVALRGWRLCVMDVRTAFLLAPLLFQEDRPTLVQVPKMFLLGGVCRETVWRVKRALYGMVISPRSWEVYRNKTLAQMRGKVPEGEVRFVPSEIDGSLWYVLVGERRAGAIICYVDDLLITGELPIAQEASQMIARTWKCTEPQWDDVTFNGFEVHCASDGLILRQDSYTKDLLARYQDLDGYEEVPAPTQLNAEDFELKAGEFAADFIRTAQTMAGELQWLAGRCRPEILYAVNLLSQAISKSPKEAVYRGGHLLKYLKRFPEAGIFYSSKPQVTPDAQVSAGAVIEGFSDASFAPNSGRSQQAVMLFMTGGLVAWSSHRQAFVTMSTAESELVAICELTTCMRSIEELVAEVMLLSKTKVSEVTKVIYTDSQSALSVCKSAAGSWRTRHLRIRGNLVRELLELPDWVSHHLEGRIMLADLGTKALAADRFSLLVDRMRVLRKRHGEKALKPAAEHVKRLLMLLCLTALVEHGEAAEIEERESFDYMFLGVCLVAVIAVWECLKTLAGKLAQCCGSTRQGRRAEEPTGSTVRAADSESSASLGYLDSEPVGLRHRSGRFTEDQNPSGASSSENYQRVSMTTRGSENSPIHEPVGTWAPFDARFYVPPSGKRDSWEIDEGRGIAIRHHPTPRLNLFVPGQAAGGPSMNQFTGERRTIGRLPNGEVRVHTDDFTTLSKPAQLLANKEWRGRTELRLKRRS